MPSDTPSVETNQILQGDARDRLSDLPESSVHMTMCSPPYFGLRDYNVEGQIGLENDFNEYIDELVAVGEELKRVLRPDGSWWLNLGDTFAGGGGVAGKPDDWNDLHADENYPNEPPARNSSLLAKSKMLIPHRVAIALEDAGWIVRSDAVWVKPNPMPHPVKDRLNETKEFVFHLVPQGDYWFDLDSIREPHKAGSIERNAYVYNSAGSGSMHCPREDREESVIMDADQALHPNGKNPGDVFDIPVRPFPEAHFACVSDDTEILTKGGWKTYDALQRGEKVATYDTDADRVELQPLSGVATYDFDGELLHIGNRDLDVLITKDHRNVTRHRDTGEIRIRRGHELVGRDEILVNAPSEWETNEGIGEPLAELVGWIIAEGSYRQSGGVRIYQQTGEDANRIGTLLGELDIPHSRRTRRGNEVCWAIPTSPWADYIRDLAPDKRLTQWLVSMPDSDIEALFDGIIGGDGHVRRDDGRVLNTEKDSVERDWFQILAFRLGYHSIDGTKDVHLTERRSIGIRGTGGGGLNVEPRWYEGVVWCPRTPSGTWVARRNGRVFITGNTFPPELCETPIKASCPPKVCADCGTPYERDSEVTDREVAGGVSRVPDNERGYADRQGQAQNDRDGLTQPTNRELGEWEQQCDCATDEFEPGIVLDPFAGAGTTCLVAKRLGRRFFGIELNPEYVAMAQKRCGIDVKNPSLVRDDEEQQGLEVFADAE